MMIIQNAIFIHINSLFIWIGNPNPCLLRFRLAAGAFLFEKRRAFFEKACFGLPKPCLLRFRLAAGFKKTKTKTTCLFEKMCVVLSKTNIFLILDNICQYLSMYLPTLMPGVGWAIK